MNYWVLPESRVTVSRTTVHRTIEVERGLEVNKDKLKAFYMKVSDKFKNRKISANRSIIPEDWDELVDTDEALVNEFEKVFDNPYVSDADDFSPDYFDGYFNMEVAMD